MQISPLINSPAAADLVPAPVAAANPQFKEMLEKLSSSSQSKEKTDAQTQAQDAAAGLVSAALILPILKQVRRSPFNTEGPFSPGMGEKAFGPEFDMQLADRIAHSPRLGIRDALADRLLKRAGSSKPVTTAPKGLNVHG
jgi:hypothetical protein